MMVWFTDSDSSLDFTFTPNVTSSTWNYTHTHLTLPGTLFYYL